LSYGSLINGRVSIVAGSSEAAKKALTIAIRYAAVRRQFPSPTFAAGAECNEFVYDDLLIFIADLNLKPLLLTQRRCRFWIINLTKTD